MRLVSVILILLSFVLFPCRAFPDNESNINKINKIDLLQDEKSSRIVITLVKLIDKLPVAMATLETVSFGLDSILSSQLSSLSPISSDGFVTKVQLFPKTSKTSFEIKRQYYSPVNFIKQEKPPALVVELPRKYFNKESWDLKPGIVKHLIRTVNDRGPVVANVLEIDLLNDNISVKVGLPDKNRIKLKEKLSNIVKNEMAFAGINANYFDVKVGNPLGTLISEGKWIVGPIYDRVAIGFSKDKKSYIDQVKLTGEVTAYKGFRKKPDLMFELSALNTPLPLFKGVGLFDSRWDREFILGENKIALIVRNNKVKKIKSESVEIPEDGFVLAGDKDGILNKVKKRNLLMISWNIDPDWSNVIEAVSGGPYLIMNGQLYVDDLSQKFKFAKKETYAPRSAIGIGKDGKLYLITVNGRNKGYSVGLTLKELAGFLEKLNLRDAINLDGGGSTTLVADGKILNYLSEHHERKISTGLLIFYKD